MRSTVAAALVVLLSISAASAYYIPESASMTCKLTQQQMDEYIAALEACGCGTTCAAPPTPTPAPTPTPKPTPPPTTAPPTVTTPAMTTAPPTTAPPTTAPPQPQQPSRCLVSRSESDCVAAVAHTGRSNQYCGLCRQNAKDPAAMQRCYGCIVQAYSATGVGYGDNAAEECHLNAYDGSMSVDCACMCVGTYDVSSCGEYCHNCAGNAGCLCCVMYYSNPFMLNEASKCVNGPAFYPSSCRSGGY